MSVMVAQGVFFNGFLLAYLVSPQACHRFVGYIEEEAVCVCVCVCVCVRVCSKRFSLAVPQVKTYTRLADDLANGRLPEWEGLPVPDIAKNYWRLKDDALFLDLIVC